MIDGLPPVFAPNLAGQTVLPFAAIRHVGGDNWDISAGRVIVDIVPGPIVNGAATTMSATVTLTGTATAPLDFTYDPVGGNGVNNVTINFGTAPGPGMPGFAPILVPMDAASLDGSIIPAPGSTGVLGIPVTLRASAFGAGQFCILGPFNNPPPAFAGACGPLADRAPPVVNVSGILNFAFGGPGELAGDTVRFPNSAVVQSFCEGTGCDAAPPVPEPSAWATMMVGLAGVGLLMRRRRIVPATR